jgi:transcription initiation factor TFIID subunit TAF12
MMEVAEVAGRPRKMVTRKAATESAAHVSATESAAHVSATESAAHVSTTESAAHVTSTESAAHMSATATVSSPAPRKRVRAQRACESGGCSQNDHGMT